MLGPKKPLPQTAEKPTSRRRRGPTLKGTIRIAERCGLAVSSIDLLPDGTRRLHFGTPPDAILDPRSEAAAAFDKWKAAQK